VTVCTVGDGHSASTAERDRTFGTLLLDHRDLAGARGLLERALAIDEKVLGPDHLTTNLVRYNLARLLLNSSNPTEALTQGEIALAANDKVLGRDDAWTKDSARVTADALHALGRTEQAKALRERYGVAGSGEAKRS
jgi:hypothetical protein